MREAINFFVPHWPLGAVHAGKNNWFISPASWRHRTEQHALNTLKRNKHQKNICIPVHCWRFLNAVSLNLIFLYYYGGRSSIKFFNKNTNEAIIDIPGKIGIKTLSMNNGGSQMRFKRGQNCPTPILKKDWNLKVSIEYSCCISLRNGMLPLPRKKCLLVDRKSLICIINAPFLKPIQPFHFWVPATGFEFFSFIFPTIGPLSQFLGKEEGALFIEYYLHAIIWEVNTCIWSPPRLVRATAPIICSRPFLPANSTSGFFAPAEMRAALLWGAQEQSSSGEQKSSRF